jgi:hypothetical protein
MDATSQRPITTMLCRPLFLLPPVTRGVLVFMVARTRSDLLSGLNIVCHFGYLNF